MARSIDSPLAPPVDPMLATLADDLPEGEGWVYEPKWDGFRALVFRDGDALYVQSRDGRPLLRYFPELAEPLRDALPARCVVDGEIVLPLDGRLDFDALQLRLHPAASRVATLAERTPAAYVVFDLLAVGDEDLRDVPFGDRRLRLEDLLEEAGWPVVLTPATGDLARARDWYHRFEGAGLDGVMAKRAQGPYTPGQRTMVKVKHARAADVVVAGFRWAKGGEGARVGSLLLGLYDDAGGLRHIGVASSFRRAKQEALAQELLPLRVEADAHPWGGEIGPGPSRWSAGRDLSFVPIRPERVAEVSFNQLSGGRFRHPARFVRWRPDKRPEDCGAEQLVVVPATELEAIFRHRRPGG